MNSTSCSPGLQHIYYQQGLQGQKVVHLFKELFLKHYDTEGALQVMVYLFQFVCFNTFYQKLSRKKIMTVSLS